MQQNQCLKVVYANPSDFAREQILITDFEFLKCLGRGVSA